MAYMKELQKSYPKGKTDENLTGDISRFDAELVLVKDDLVGFLALSSPPARFGLFTDMSSSSSFAECYQASSHWTQGGVEARREGDQDYELEPRQGSFSSLFAFF